MTIQHRRSAWLPGLAALLLVGCSAPPPVPVDDAPAMGFPSRGRSVTFASHDHTVATAGPRWYDARNDGGLAVFAGYDAPREEFITTRQFDRVHVNNGRVRDHSHGYTLRESFKASLRY